jgi:chromosomal replication initiator protein
MTALALKKDAADVKEIFRSKIDAAEFSAWIEPLAVSEEDGIVILSAPSRFSADFIRSTFSEIISDIEAENGIRVDLAVARPRLRVIENPANDNRKAGAEENQPGFDEFVCGEANQFALHAVKKCADGTAAFSPLVIHGATGSGKSMLLDLLKRNARDSAVMTTGSRFVSEFVRSMRDNSVFAWKDAMRSGGLFIMDGVQELAGKKASADEFLSLVDDLIRAKKTVVLTASVAPSQITGFDRRLVSILASGLSVDLSAPDPEVREKILARSGVAESAAKIIAARAPANGHVLSGIAKKIAAWMELDCGDLSEQVLEKLLGDVLEKQNSPAGMVKKMCAKLGVALDDVMSAARTKRIVFARQKIMAALKRSTKLTLSEIGALVGGRNHASVLYAISQIEKAKLSDMLLESELSELAK